MEDGVRTRRLTIWRRSWFPVALLTIAALVLRVAGLGGKSLWADEAYASGLMDMSLPQLIRLAIAGSPHPPLAFLFIRASTFLFGGSEMGLRAIPAIFSALAVVPLTAIVSRRLGARTAIWAGALWVVSPFAVSLGQEAWLYGLTAFLGFLLVDVCDRAWHGAPWAYWTVVPLALLGMLVQHLFAIYVAAGFGLYLAVPRETRVPLRKPLILAGLLAAFYAPFIPLLLKQGGFRAERIRRAGLDMSVVYAYRYLLRVPTVFARLIPDGLLLQLGRHLLSDMKQLAFWAVFALIDVFLILCLFLDRTLRRPLKVWLGLILALPLVLFLKEDPTVRHLTVLWIPLAFGAAAAFRRYRATGPLTVLAAAVMLLPYYNVRSFPYHRSDWRGAVRYVERNLRPDEGILVLGKLSGGLAWDYYSTSDQPRVALGGENPYSERLEPGRDAQAVLDSIRALHDRVWIVCDCWEAPGVDQLLEGDSIFSQRWVSPNMLVVHAGLAGEPDGSRLP